MTVGEKLNRNKQGCARVSVTKTPDSHRKKNNVNYPAKQGKSFDIN